MTPRAQRGLLGLRRQHAMQVQKFAWKAPEDDGLWSQVYQQELETTLKTLLQGRVVDLVGALKLWKPNPSYAERSSASTTPPLPGITATGR